MAVTKTPFLLTLISTMRRRAAHKNPLVKENTDTRGHTHTHTHTRNTPWVFSGKTLWPFLCGKQTPPLGCRVDTQNGFSPYLYSRLLWETFSIERGTSLHSSSSVDSRMHRSIKTLSLLLNFSFWLIFRRTGHIYVKITELWDSEAENRPETYEYWHW